MSSLKTAIKGLSLRIKVVEDNLTQFPRKNYNDETNNKDFKMLKLRSMEQPVGTDQK